MLRCQRGGSLQPYSRFSRPEPATLCSKQLLSCTHEAEWTPFQTDYVSGNLIAPAIEPGPQCPSYKFRKAWAFNMVYTLKTSVCVPY
jgi:hypothetical protein